MKLYNDKNFRVLVADIETLKPCTDIGFYNPDTGEWHEFEMSAFKNDIYKFVKFYNSKSWDYVCGYNWIGFDGPVLQYIVDNVDKWFDLTGLQIAEKVHAYAQKVIDNSRYHLKQEYLEEDFSIKPIDVYKIFGLDNEARISSLKKCEFQIDYPSVEEMPIDHTVEFLTEQQVNEVKSYRRNDVLATYELLKLCIGDCQHPIYTGNNQLEIRDNIRNEFGIECLNMSDINIGEEIIKDAYCKVTKKQKHEISRKGTFRKEINLGKCIPSYVSFKTKQLQDLLKDVKSRKIGQFDKFEREFEFYGTKYILALGGLHSVNRNEKYEATDEIDLDDDDVQSYYPAIVVENGYYPAHLGIQILNEYTKMYLKRLELKPLAKKDKKIKGIVDGLKLALNAVFGKMGSAESWLYDKQSLLSVTLTGQFCLLMLIEEYELNGFHVFSANTDGVTTLVPKSRREEIEAIKKEWEKKTKFVLENAKYKKIIYSTVNDYIAVTIDGKTKTKGDYIKDFELWKNKSYRVIPLALEEYFINGKDPIEFIKNHKYIYDFCIMARATGKLYIEMQKDGDYQVTKEMLEKDGWIPGIHGWIPKELEVWTETNEIESAISFENAVKIYRQSHPAETKRLKKLVRHYLSSDSPWTLYKRGIGSTGKPMNVRQNAPDAIGNIYSQYFNQFEVKIDYKIAYEHYVLPVLERIDKIDKTKKAQKYVESFKPQIQGSLF